MPLKSFLALSNSPWHVLHGMQAKYHQCPSSAKLLLRGFESFWLYFPVIMVFLSHSLRITSMDRFSKSYAFASQVPSAVAQFFSDNSLPLTWDYNPHSRWFSIYKSELWTLWNICLSLYRFPCKMGIAFQIWRKNFLLKLECKITVSHSLPTQERRPISVFSP